MQSQVGIPHVFGTFQEAFRKQRKGKGHEAHDLGCLLDMYERWAHRLFPYCDFDTFISRVANLHGKPGGKATTGSTLKVRAAAACRASCCRSSSKPARHPALLRV